MISFRNDTLSGSVRYIPNKGSEGNFDEDNGEKVKVENIILEEVNDLAEFENPQENLDLSGKERKELTILNTALSQRFVRHGSCKKKIEQKKQRKGATLSPGVHQQESRGMEKDNHSPQEAPLRRTNTFPKGKPRRYSTKTGGVDSEVANIRSSMDHSKTSHLGSESSRHGVVVRSGNSDESDSDENTCVAGFCRRQKSEKRTGICVDNGRGSRTAWYNVGDLSTLQDHSSHVSSVLGETFGTSSDENVQGVLDKPAANPPKDQLNTVQMRARPLKRAFTLPAQHRNRTKWYHEVDRTTVTESEKENNVTCHDPNVRNDPPVEMCNSTGNNSGSTLSTDTSNKSYRINTHSDGTDGLLRPHSDGTDGLLRPHNDGTDGLLRPVSTMSDGSEITRVSQLCCRDSLDAESISDDNWTISSLSSEEYMADTFLGLSGLLKGARSRTSLNSDQTSLTASGIHNLTLKVNGPGSNRSTYYSTHSVCSDDLSVHSDTNLENRHPNLVKAKSLSLPRNGTGKLPENRHSHHSDCGSLYFDAEESLTGTESKAKDCKLNHNVVKSKSCHPRDTVYISKEAVLPEVLESFTFDDSTTCTSIEESTLVCLPKDAKVNNLPMQRHVDCSVCGCKHGDNKAISDYSNVCPQCQNVPKVEEVFTDNQSSQSVMNVKQQRCSSDKELPAPLCDAESLADNLTVQSRTATLERTRRSLYAPSSEEQLGPVEQTVGTSIPSDVLLHGSDTCSGDDSKQKLCSVNGHLFQPSGRCSTCDVVMPCPKTENCDESAMKEGTGKDVLSESGANSSVAPYLNIFDNLDSICTGECFQGRHCEWAVSIGDLVFMKTLEHVCKPCDSGHGQDTLPQEEDAEEVEESLIHQVEEQDNKYYEEYITGRSIFYTQMTGTKDIRRKENIINIDPFDLAIRRELLTEKFTILPGRDDKGAAIALFTARLHYPQQTTHQAVLKALVFQLDASLESIDTQRNGLVFIYDMSHSKYQNFDYELSIKILSMLKGSYPARLKKVLIVTAPLWFRAPFKILRLFVREKLRDRVHTVTLSQLPLHIPMSSLARRMGGNLEINHKAWLRKCLVAMSQDNSLHSNIEMFFMGTENHNILDMSVTSITSDTLTPTGGDDSNYYISDMDSETSKETISEKHNCETQEKEVAEEKYITSPLSSPGDGHSLKRSSDSSPTQIFSDEDPPPLPQRKRRPVSDNMVESIHMPESGGMSVSEFMEHTRKKGRQGLFREYAFIKQEPPSGTFEVSKATCNLPKNRYTDVLCFDHSRVRLNSGEDDPSLDYINANYVDGYKQKNAFISSQGPLPRTFPDFWRMIWEGRVLIVVMTTRTVERSRLKCGQYWPAEEETSAEYGDFAVINNGSNCCENYTVTSLIVQNTRTSETREVTHFQFTSWPDYGVPHSAQAFLQFMFHIRTHQAERVQKMDPSWTGHALGPPIVVHCSAGIGRTGTFITMDICTRRLADIGTLDVQRTVKRIRSQRAFSIQMPDQYVFCHLALIEHAQKEGQISQINLDGFDGSSSESE